MYRGGLDGTIPFHFRKPVPTFTPGSTKDRGERLSQGNHSTFRELTTDALQEGLSRCPLEKFAFLFGD